jgi:hypothetical protein
MNLSKMTEKCRREGSCRFCSNKIRCRLSGCIATAVTASDEDLFERTFVDLLLRGPPLRFRAMKWSE